MSEYPPNWDELRARALERDGFRCRNCKQSAKWVHHVVPLSTGLGTNNLDNLFSICDSCHATLEPRLEGLIARRDKPSKPLEFDLEREVLDVMELNSDAAAAELMKRANDYAAKQSALEQRRNEILRKLSDLNDKLPPDKRHYFIPSAIETARSSESSKNVRNIQAVLVTFEDLERQLGIVDEKTLYEAISRRNRMTKEQAQAVAQLLIREGIIYSPKPGYLKRTAA